MSPGSRLFIMAAQGTTAREYARREWSRSTARSRTRWHCCGHRTTNGIHSWTSQMQSKTTATRLGRGQILFRTSHANRQRPSPATGSPWLGADANGDFRRPTTAATAALPALIDLSGTDATTFADPRHATVYAFTRSPPNRQCTQWIGYYCPLDVAPGKSVFAVKTHGASAPTMRPTPPLNFASADPNNLRPATAPPSSNLGRRPASDRFTWGCPLLRPQGYIGIEQTRSAQLQKGLSTPTDLRGASLLA